MGENLTIRQRAKIAYLRRLCMAWIRFTDIKWQGVQVIVEDGDVNIVWYQIIYLKNPDGTKFKHFNSSFKYFPIKDLSKQIKDYRKKINEKFKNRHNPNRDEDK